MFVKIVKEKQEAASFIADKIQHLVESKDQPVLGLATGGTMIPIYEGLIDRFHKGLDFSNVMSVNLDEYVGLTSDHSQSYATFMEEYLFQHINIKRNHTHIPNGNTNSDIDECNRYNNILSAYPVDLQLLGIGSNGHIGFNEPGPHLHANTHVVTLKKETIQANARFFQREVDVPKKAITMGMKPIMQAKEVILVAFGSTKAQAIFDAMQGPIRTQLPASFLQLHTNVTFVLDEQAASILMKENTHSV